MKKSISYLPSINQRDLHSLVESILTRIKQTEMIILFSSYARNKYVVYDEKYKFGKIQFYVSDYDIQIITSSISDGIVGKALDNNRSPILYSSQRPGQTTHCSIYQY